MDFHLLNPNVRYCMLTKRSHSYNEKMFAYDYRLFYIVEKNMEIETEIGTYHLKPFDLLILPPNLGYRLVFPNNNLCTYIVLNFDLDASFINTPPQSPDTKDNFKIRHDFSPLRLPPFNEPFYLINTAGFNDSLFECYKLSKNEPPFFKDQISCIIKDILIKAVVISMEKYQPQSQNLADDIKLFLENNCTKNPSNSEISEHFRYHSYYLNNIFKKEFGQSIHAYINECKLKIAKKLLLSTDDSIENIALKSGFSNISWFSELFKNKVGLTPSKYRQLGR